MRKKNIQYLPFLRASLAALQRITRHPKAFVPDILFILFTITAGSAFLATNNLFAPLFHPGPLNAFRSQIQYIISHFPSLLQFLISLCVTITLNVLFGVKLFATRYYYLEQISLNKTVTLWQAYRKSGRYFTGIVLIKLAFMLAYFLITFSYFSLQSTPTLSLYAFFVFSLLLFVIFKIIFFFAVQNLYSGHSGLRVLASTIHHFTQFPKQTLIALALVTLAEFIVTLFIGFLPTAWARFALASNLFSMTTLILSAFFIIRTFFSTTLTLWQELFKFLIYKQHS